MKPASDITDLSDGLAVAAVGPRYAAADAAIAIPDDAEDAASLSRWSDYYELTKPRMNFLVVVTTMVGHYMAARGHGSTDWALVLHTLLGTALTAAGASVLNQYVEREHDAKMIRTARRPLPAGRVSPLEALLLGVFFSVGGVIYLTLFVNALTATLGVITLATYVFVYTPAKRHTTLCTVIGAVPGALPPVMGWTAAGAAASPEAVALFAILFFWQLPHFLAIAILYRDDYAAGGFKMLPVVDPDLTSTGRQIVIWSMALLPVTFLPAVFGMAGAMYFAAAVVLGIGFCGFAVRCALTRERVDARRLFFVSIIYLPALLVVMMADKIWRA
jgi:protoheme IX farnesyltransferase